MSKVCEKCGSLYDETAGPCPNCGKSFSLNKAEYKDSEKLGGSGNFQKEIYVPAKKNIFFSRILPIILCLLLILGIIFGIIFGMKSCSGDVKSKGYLYTPKKEFLKTDEDTGIMYMNNIVILFLKEGTQKKEAERIADSLNGKIVGELPVIDQYQIEIPEHTLSELQDICLNLEKEDCVVKATYDAALYLAEDAVTPNDPWPSMGMLSEDWNESNPSGNNWWLEAIHAPSAWEYNDQVSTAKVGVIDDGFDLSHDDLKNVIKSHDSHNDATDHGSHVAGIIGAEANNNKGITGILWDCEIHARDWMLNDEQNEDYYLQTGEVWNTTSAILGNTVMLIEEGSKVVNLSIGCSASIYDSSLPQSTVDVWGEQSSTYLAQLLARDHDFVVVQSAGNGNAYGESVDTIYNGLFCSITEDNCFTTSNVTARDIIDRVIVVGAAKNDGNNKFSQFYWSNAGDRVDICAPGSVYSTVPGGSGGMYAEMQGTSMAAPVVTAVSAFAWSANESLTGAQIKEIVCDDANTRFDVEDNTSYDHPLINTYRMVDAELAVKAALKSSGAAPKTSEPPDDDVVDYSDVIKQYRHAIKNDFYEHGGNGAKNYLSTTLLYDAIDAIHDNEEVHVYYALYDINRDGISECVIGAEGENFVQYDLFTYDGDEPVELFSVDNYGGNAIFEIYDNGVVHVINDSLATVHTYYELKSNATNLYDLGSAIEEFGEDNDEYEQLKSLYETNEIQLDWEEIDYKTPPRVTSDDRDIVLVLDVSGSMEGEPIEETKKSAIKFIDTIFNGNLDASIGIVTYDDNASMAADFSDDQYYLEETVEFAEGGGGTDIEEALELASDMLSGSRAKQQTIVLMSDGVPNYGKRGDDLVDFADTIKDDDIYIYTLGFFSNLGNDKAEAQELMERLASVGCHYEVEDSDDLIFFFGDIADQLNGEKYIYIRVACPVDVTIEHNGEILSSDDYSLNTRTSFGSLTFEENKNSSSPDDKIKVIRLKEGPDYNVSIVGTGDGMMNYTIGFMDDEGKYSDMREFKDIAINDVTVIDTVAKRADKTTLKVDNDGDNKYELTYEAGENGIGKLKKSYTIWIIIGVVAFIILAGVITLVIILIVKSGKKRPRGGGYSGGDSLNGGGYSGGLNGGGYSGGLNGGGYSGGLNDSLNGGSNGGLNGGLNSGGSSGGNKDSFL